MTPHANEREDAGMGPCAGCGHDPACGFASTYSDSVGEQWWCHTDDHSCYAPSPSQSVKDAEHRVRLANRRKARGDRRHLLTDPDSEDA